MSDTAVLTAVRSAHRFDENALATYLERSVDGFRGPLALRQFEGGQSNPTFLLETPTSRYVLRKQPPGELLRSAHQVDREFRVMHALADTDVPVPRMLAACDDVSVIGTKFYVMEYVVGRVFSDSLLPDLDPEERSAVYTDLARVLACLHRVDPSAVGLDSFGRPGNYYARQISRWSKQYLASKTEEVEAMDHLMKWLPAHIPETDETVVVHGDYRPGNVLIHPNEPRIVAVLDWELSTLGHPLADLGYICMDFHVTGHASVSLASPEARELGIPSEAEFVDAYCRAAGRERIENWDFFLTYNLFRSAAIIEGVYRRGLDGNASSETAVEYKGVCRARAENAWSIARQGRS
jgi:aminoglycoside phosphotransferase (APT) family kinase protein